MTNTPQMTLWWAPSSPYVRMVLIAAEELGVADRFERQDVTPDTIVDALAPDNPLAQIPTLVVDSRAIYDTRSILYWLDDQFGPRLIPREQDAHAAVITGFALGSGLVDAGNLRRNLSLHEDGQRPDGLIGRLAGRMTRALDGLDASAGAFSDAFTADQIAAAAALGYLDFRFGEEDWRGARPTLAAWYDGVSGRPSMTSTVHPA